MGEFMDRPSVRIFWWPRFIRIARWFVDNERARRHRIAESASEVLGRLEIAAPAGPFELVAKADRIDRLAGGGLVIIDYKTGEPPTPREVTEGVAPQLTLEAAIAERGGFDSFGAASVETVEYWRLRGDARDGERQIETSNGLIRQAVDGLGALVAAFDDQRTPYIALPWPHLAPRYSDYEHLERAREWAAHEQGDD
jgi:ATP-dependent helicase/nuclease subunit B